MDFTERIKDIGIGWYLRFYTFFFFCSVVGNDVDELWKTLFAYCVCLMFLDRMMCCFALVLSFISIYAYSFPSSACASECSGEYLILSNIFIFIIAVRVWCGGLSLRRSRWISVFGLIG